MLPLGKSRLAQFKKEGLSKIRRERVKERETESERERQRVRERVKEREAE